MLKDLRIQCRARGLNPGGSREALMDRMKEHMLQTGNFTLVTEYNGEIAHGVPREVANRADHASEGAIGVNNNNYSRNEGQNVGNFITDRPSSRVLAPPGGATNWSFAGDVPADPIRAKPAHSPIKQAPMSAAAAEAPGVAEAVSEDLIGAANMGVAQNNYARPSGQNVGNFITDKPSSRVLAPPGGGSSIVFG
ncbi:hypothetical protein CHLNCDRAFT_140278 [Chlorella variabilis]|uniref:SAP domain-containing protein n=1 Tax=Chlorella variabilis TaxID=554065 RepID=E1Z6N5_CHLVA|nr:hypothetical protein CHLNCDRAFT_140278 [Chlorella variabilis]EFN58381.1 hypothetical protein CHLNCDRAFT_140278 [Chlorella variabilis]|eukprot:XP_005850483.1 hypothetical protein CHLNCDRAFT_140278 [Chlorella variabilis]